MRKAILYIACSLDGYIATIDDDLSFLNDVQKKGEDYGYTDFTNSVDTVFMGRKTYDKVASMGFPNPHPSKEFYVITRTKRPSFENISFYTKDVNDLLHDLKQKNGKHIYIDGGANLVHHLLKANLIDELIISVIPVLLGDGIR